MISLSKYRSKPLSWWLQTPIYAVRIVQNSWLRPKKTFNAPFKRQITGTADGKLNLVIGAGGVFEPGWIPSDVETLDLLDAASWEQYLEMGTVDQMLAEHVWEHLSEEQGKTAAKTCFRFLKNGGRLRVAVPDGLHPDPAFITYVSPPEMGHQVLYTHVTLKQVFESAGFRVELLEFFDESGTFHQCDWLPENGMIHRSARFDERNSKGLLSCTSIILDACKG